MNPLDPQVRISDSDRERAMADLAMHYTDGRLEHEEYDERLDAVWTARTRADLAVLFADLPRAPIPPVRASRPVKAGPQGGSRRTRVPLLPVLALLIAASILLEAPVWLLVFPLMFWRSRHGGRHGSPCAPAHGQTDYRRPGKSSGW